MGSPYPVFIPSRGRFHRGGTYELFKKRSVPNRMRIIVEEDEFNLYCERFGEENLLLLPQWVKDQYDPLDGHGQDFNLGSGPARQYAWEVARKEGHDWHWVVDDNVVAIAEFGDHISNRATVDSSDSIHSGYDYHPSPRWMTDMERYITSWRNVAMGGPHSVGFIVRIHKYTMATPNSRIYSFNLIRTAAPFKWRGRYNEDTILSLDMLTQGWRTILCRRWLMQKPDPKASKVIGGGNAEKLYASGTGSKSRLLARVHPKHVQVITRFGRIHHFVDWRKFKDMPLIPETAARSRANRMAATI